MEWEVSQEVVQEQESWQLKIHRYIACCCKQVKSDL